MRYKHYHFPYKAATLPVKLLKLTKTTPTLRDPRQHPHRRNP
jgi:hypothetical protein